MTRGTHYADDYRAELAGASAPHVVALRDELTRHRGRHPAVCARTTPHTITRSCCATSWSPDVSIPLEQVAVPEHVLALAHGAALEPVWRNDYGGLTFRTDDERYIKFGRAQSRVLHRR